MNLIKSFLVLAILQLYGTGMFAQCNINIPNNVYIVNGLEYATGTSAYVGPGDTLMNQGFTTVYVDSAGILDCSFASPMYVYAANYSQVDATGVDTLYYDTSAWISGTFLYSILCTPMLFNFQSIVSNLDSFNTFASPTCAGPNLTVNTNNYTAGINIITDWGDGNTSSAPLLPGTGNIGYAYLSHTYAATGSYAIKQLYNDGANDLDSLFFTFDHTYCSGMQVSYYLDNNSNCNYDPNTDSLNAQALLVEVDSNSIPIDTLSVTGGFYYSALGATGDIYGFKLIGIPPGLVASCPVSGIIYDTVQSGISAMKYQGLDCASGSSFDLGMDVVFSNATNTTYVTKIVASNPYCAPQNAVLTMNFDPGYSFFVADPVPTSQSSGTATWNINNLSVLSPQDIFIQLNGGTWPTGTPITTTYTITPTTGDVNPADNTLIVQDTTTGSFDPNAIYVRPPGCITAGTNLTYTITFENMGSGPAENIYILDTLPAGLDASTMRLQFASHNMNIKEMKYGQQTIFRFDFPNIMLPDSSDHAGRNGGLTYTIDANSALPPGYMIHHNASIYFDYNDPVLTNTSETMICWPAKTANIEAIDDATIYPNPANETLTVATKGDHSGYAITNSVGQLVLKGELSWGETKIPVKELNTGIYFINLKGKGANSVKKFVKH